MRAPSWNETAQEFLSSLAERDWPDGRPDDRGREATGSPAALDATLLAAIAERLGRIRWSTRDVETFVGRHFSTPKAHVVFEPPEPLPIDAFMRRAARSGVALDLRATLLYRGSRGYIAGESCALPAASRKQFQRLADRRRLDAATVQSMRGDDAACRLLHDWWSDGWIGLAEGSRGDRDGTP